MAGVWGQRGTGWDEDERVQKVANLAWDTETLSWVRLPLAASAGGGSVSSTVTTALFDKSTPTTLYVGRATSSSGSESPVWQIKRIVFSATGLPESIKFAANGAYVCRWDQRESLVYE